MKLQKIISGGQTGVDLAALHAASYLGIPTGGLAPKGWVNEDGRQEELMRSFGMVECAESGYPARTKQNILAADATLIFIPDASIDHERGTRLTFELCKELKRPCRLITDCSKRENDREGYFPLGLLFVHAFIKSEKVKTLNIAGPRESRWRGCQGLVFDWLVRVFEGLK